MASPFDYQCLVCRHIQEEWHGLMEEPDVACIKCNSKTRKVISGGLGVAYKGSGWANKKAAPSTYEEYEDSVEG